MVQVQATTETTEAVLYCPQCMYDLRGLTGEQCPECGAGIARERLALSSIPWVHREGLGLGAFFKTVVRATFKTRHFCLEVARPVSLGDARKFRRQMVWLLLAVCSVAALLITYLVTEEYDAVYELWQYSPLLGSVLALAGVVLGWVFLMGLTGFHMYWFHPKGLPIEQQNRAVALSHYACAPLVVFGLAAAGLVVAHVFSVVAEDDDNVLLGYLAAGQAWLSLAIALLAVVAYLFVCTRMARHAAGRSGVAGVLLWLVLPVVWLVWGGLLFVGLPLVGVYLYIMLGTL